MIIACALTKLARGGEDERDDGRRQVLNLGHTVAHAIETGTGYARYRHGEAVALGLLAALRISGREDSATRSWAASEPGPPDRARRRGPRGRGDRATARDKKRRGEGPVPFVLLEAPGERSPAARSIAISSLP